MRDPGGSGFIVTASAKPWKRPTTKPESPEDRYKLGYEHARQRKEDMRARYFVTNSHVIAAGNHFVRVNVFQGQQPIVKEITEWAYHPDADLVIGFFEYAAGQGTVGYHPIGANFLISEHTIQFWDIGIGDSVFMLGLFAGHFSDSNRMLPAARFGNITMMPAQRIEKLQIGGTEESFLVEMYSMGGFSGSPVFVRKLPFSPTEQDWWNIWDVEDPNEALRHIASSLTIENFMPEITTHVLGINWGHLPQRMKVQYKDSDDVVEDVFVRGNHNIACVIPAWKIHDLLMEPELVEHRAKLTMEDKEKSDSAPRPPYTGEADENPVQ